MKALKDRAAAYLGIAPGDVYEVVERENGEVVVLLTTYAKHVIPAGALAAAEQSTPKAVPTKARKGR